MIKLYDQAHWKRWPQWKLDQINLNKCSGTLRVLASFGVSWNPIPSSRSSHRKAFNQDFLADGYCHGFQIRWLLRYQILCLSLSQIYLIRKKSIPNWNNYSSLHVWVLSCFMHPRVVNAKRSAVKNWTTWLPVSANEGMWRLEIASDKRMDIGLQWIDNAITWPLLIGNEKDTKTMANTNEKTKTKTN